MFDKKKIHMLEMYLNYLNFIFLIFNFQNFMFSTYSFKVAETHRVPLKQSFVARGPLDKTKKTRSHVENKTWDYILY